MPPSSSHQLHPTLVHTVSVCSAVSLPMAAIASMGTLTMPLLSPLRVKCFKEGARQAVRSAHPAAAPSSNGLLLLLSVGSAEDAGRYEQASGCW